MLVEIPVLPEAPSTDYHVPIAKVCKHEVTETQGKTKGDFFSRDFCPLPSSLHGIVRQPVNDFRAH